MQYNSSHHRANGDSKKSRNVINTLSVYKLNNDFTQGIDIIPIRFQKGRIRPCIVEGIFIQIYLGCFPFSRQIYKKFFKRETRRTVTPHTIVTKTGRL